MNKYLFIVLLFLGQIPLWSQNTCNIYFETRTSNSTTIEIDVKANGFTSVLGFQMYVKWDSTVLRKTAVLNGNPSLSGLSFGASQLGNNIQSANWYDNSGNGVTLPSGSVLFTIKYSYNGDPCDTTKLRLTNPDNFRRSLITYSFAEETEYPLNYTPKEVQIPGTNCNGSSGSENGVGLLIDCITAPAGTQVCVPIRVDSFSQIATLQYSISWDPTKLSYVSVTNNFAANAIPPADDLATNVVNNNTFIYTMATTNPITIPNNGILIEICFQVLGNNGDVVNLNFANQVPIEITNFADVTLPYYTHNGCVNIGNVDNTVTFTVAGVDGAPLNKPVCVNILGKNFKNIESFQYKVKWDEKVLKWKGLGTVNKIGISAGAGGHISSCGNGCLKVAWNDAFGKTIPDNDTLYQLCFDIIGPCESSTVVSIVGDTEIKIEVTSNEVLLPHTEIAGTVKVEKCTFPKVTWVVTGNTCNGYSDGSIYVTLEGVSSNNYNFSWYKGSTLVTSGDGKSSLLAISAGTYKVIIKDIADPTKTYTSDIIVVSEPAPWNVGGNITNQTCTGKGTITLNVSGNNPPYTYQWTPSSIGNTPNAINLNAGVYTVTITDSKQCPSTNKSFTVTSDISQLKVDGVFKDMTCKEANNGEITLTVSGGCTPYTITWSDGQASNNLKRQNLVPGTYKATVSDAQGQSVEKTYTVTNSTEIVITETVTNGVLSSISINVSGGSGTYTSYSWTGPNGYTSSSKDISGLAKGDYTIIVKDSRGCEKSKLIKVSGIIDPITFDVKVDNSSFNGFGVRCKGECNGKVTATIVANEPYVITMNGSPISSFPTNLCVGTYTFKITDAASKTKEVSVTITEPSALKVDVEELNCENSGKEDGSIKVVVTGGVPEYTYKWAGSNSTSALADNLAKGNYSVSVTDKNNCSLTSNLIKVENCDKSQCYKGSIIVTPNNDGFNDFFTIQCSEDLSETYLYIYNRLGNEVYKQANYDGTWNGLNNDGNELPEDGYLWVFVGKNELGVKEVFKGSVTLLRD